MVAMAAQAPHRGHVATAVLRRGKRTRVLGVVGCAYVYARARVCVRVHACACACVRAVYAHVCACLYERAPVYARRINRGTMRMPTGGPHRSRWHRNQCPQQKQSRRRRGWSQH